MQLLPLVAATYFMVCGGAYGIEDILGGAGYGVAILILLVMPFLWSLPTALMVGELASALPVDGGFYVWVRRAMGPFWGYQEGWLSLAASIFDMAIYPAIFVSYLGKFDPALTAGWHHFGWALLVVAVARRGICAVLPRWAMARGIFCAADCPVCGTDGAGLLAWIPCAPGGALGRSAFAAGDCAGHSGGDVELHGLGQCGYRGRRGGESAAELSAGDDLVDDAGGGGLSAAAGGDGGGGDLDGELFNRRLGRRGRLLGGPLLGLAVIAGGAINGFGMFNALVLSYTRLPMAMAEDGMLPQHLARRNRRGVPWVSVLCAARRGRRR